MLQKIQDAFDAMRNLSTIDRVVLSVLKTLSFYFAEVKNAHISNAVCLKSLNGLVFMYNPHTGNITRSKNHYQNIEDYFNNLSDISMDSIYRLAITEDTDANEIHEFIADNCNIIESPRFMEHRTGPIRVSEAFLDSTENADEIQPEQTRTEEVEHEPIPTLSTGMSDGVSAHIQHF